MTKFSFKKLTYIVLSIGIVFVGVGLNINQAQAAAGDFTLTVNNELAVALAGATVSVSCPGGSSSSTMTDAGGGSYTQVAATMQDAATGCGDTEVITFTVAKDGYVTTVNTSTTYTILSSPDTYTLDPGVPFGVKVVLDDETVANSNVASANSVQAAGVSCTESGSTGVYYCIVPLASLSTEVIAQKDGYVQKTISNAYNDRLAATDAQRIVGTGGDVTTAFNFQHAHKITATREADGASITGATITAGGTSCPEDTGGGVGNYYCPTPVGSDNGGVGNVSITKTGYVTNTSFGTSNRTAQTDAQGTVAATGVQFELKIIVADELGTATTGNTVTFAGASADVTTSTNTYYFAQDGANSVVINKSGFINNATTNTGLGSNQVTLTNAAQTVITLGNSAASAAVINAAGNPNAIKGLQYMLKSVVLKSEVGGAVTDIAAGTLAANGTPSADVTITAGGGAAITASAVSSTVIYIAATGDAGGNDTITVQVQNVTVDSGTANGASLVKATLADTGDLINGAAAQKTFDIGTGGSANITTTGFKYPLKITSADELGNSINIAALTTSTFNATTYYYSATNVAYWASTSTGAVVINKSGYEPNATTNTGFSSVATSQTAQTSITLGANSAATSITTEIDNPVKGLAYILKSAVLKSEIGGAVTSLAAGQTSNGTPSVDVTIVASNGASIVASAVSGDAIFIAATGDGATGGTDTFTVQVQNATVDSGAANGANLVKATLSDSSGFVATGTLQKTFDIGTGGSGAITTTGFKYPMKVTAADQLGNAITIAAITTKTYDGNTPYYSTGSDAYWANSGATKSLVLSRNGFTAGATTNTGFTSVTTSQDAQTSVTMGNNAAATSTVTETANTAEGFVYLLRSDMLKSQLGGAVTALADGNDQTGGTTSADVTIAASGGASVVASAVASNVIYIAATGDGSADDAFTVQVQNATVDSGTANGASLVRASITDATNLINGGTEQTFQIGTDASSTLKNVVGFEYPLKVVVADELANAINIPNVGTSTYNGVAVYTSSTNTAYFANVGLGLALVLQKAGYVPNETTNTGFSSVGTNQTATTTITLNASGASAVAVAAGTSVSRKGFQYVLKSAILNTEVAIAAVTDIADGNPSSPSADVTLTASNGATVIESAVSSTILYIAATGNGATGGSDTITVQLQNVTADGGSANAASLVKADIVDVGNFISADTAQKTFDIGGATGDIQNPTGFAYPLKVVVTNERGTAVNIVTLDTKKYDTVAPYYSTTNNAYYGNTGSNKGLAIELDGYLNASTTNTGLGDVSTSQNTSTTITFASSSAYSSAVTAGATPTVKGLQFGQVVTITTEVLAAAITPDTVTAGSGNTSCTISSNVAYCPVPVAQDGTTDNVTIVKDGYVTNTSGDTTDRTNGTSAQAAITVSNVQYSQKITVIREGDNAALTGASISTTGPTSFTENGSTGVYYGAVILADDNGAITVTKTGYKTNTSATASNRTVGTDAQGTSTATALFQLKLIVTDELGTAVNVSALSTSTFNGAAPDVSSTNTAYWAVTAASGALAVQKDGYVNASTTNAGLADITTTASNQTIVTMGNNAVKSTAISGTGSTAKGLEYALKVTLTLEGGAVAATGVTVTSGDSFGVTCAEGGSTGIYYCIVPVANTGVTAKTVKTGFATKNLTYVDRTAVTDAQGTLTASFSASLGPTITSVQASPIASTTVTVAWTTDISASSTVEYGTTSAYGSSTTSSTLATSHSIDLSGLAPSTAYHFRVKSTDGSANTTVSTDNIFTTAASGADTTAPTLTSIQASSITSSSVSITWTTNESASSSVEYGTTSSYGSSTASSTLVDGARTVPLTGLTASTLYHFRVNSSDASANTGTSVDQTFTTAASGADTTKPVITDVQMSTSTATTATITWTTDESASSSVQYGTTSAYGSTVTTSTMVTSHSVTLTGLTSNTTYHFRVKSSDASGNIQTSVDNLLLTLIDDTTATLAVTSITPSSTFATADSTYENGWSWKFNVTVPTSETSSSMKFADWISGSNTIAMFSSSTSTLRFYSLQSSNASSSASAIYIGAANTYPTSSLSLASDLDANTAGRQIQIIVEARVPTGSAGGSYSTSYGVQSQ